MNRFANGTGTLTVTGAGSTAMTSGEFRIADEGVGTVDVQFLQDEGLPFGDVLTDDFVAQASGRTAIAVT